MPVLRSLALRALMFVLLAPGVASAREPLHGFNAADAALIGPLRVVVVIEEVDAVDAAGFQDRKYRDEFRAAVDSDPKLIRAKDNSTGKIAAEAGFIMFVASFGGGLIGGIQAANKEADAIDALGAPVLARIPEQRVAHHLDQALADAVRDAVQATGRFTVDANAEVFTAEQGMDVRSRGDVGRWVTKHNGADRRATLFVGLRHGVPITLAGVYGMAEVWLVVPQGMAVRVTAGVDLDQRPDYLTHHADGTPRRSVLKGGEAPKVELIAREPTHLGRHALFTTPVPLDDLQRPPSALVDQRIAAIGAEFDPLIERQQDRDLRRDLKGQRKRELDAAPYWTPVELTEYMRDAWVAPPGDNYPRLVGEAQRNLAQRIAASLIAAD